MGRWLLWILALFAARVYCGTVKPGEISGPVLQLCSQSSCVEHQCDSPGCSASSSHSRSLPSLRCLDVHGSFRASGTDTDGRGGKFRSLWPRVFYDALKRQDALVLDFFPSRNCTGKRDSYSQAALLPCGSCRRYQFTFYDEPEVTYNNGVILYPQWAGSTRDPLRCASRAPSARPTAPSAHPTASPGAIVEKGEISGPVIRLCGAECIARGPCRLEECPWGSPTRSIRSLSCTDVPGRVTFGANTRRFTSMWSRVMYEARDPSRDISPYGSRGSERITHDFYNTKNCSGTRDSYHQGPFMSSGVCRQATFIFQHDPHKYLHQVVRYPLWQGTSRDPLICGADSMHTGAASTGVPLAPTAANSSGQQFKFTLQIWEIALLALAGAHVFVLFGYGVWRCCESRQEQRSTGMNMQLQAF